MTKFKAWFVLRHENYKINDISILKSKKGVYKVCNFIHLYIKNNIFKLYIILYIKVNVCVCIYLRKEQKYTIYFFVWEKLKIFLIFWLFLLTRLPSVSFLCECWGKPIAYKICWTETPRRKYIFHNAHKIYTSSF